MKRSALLLALAILIPAGEARADFVQDISSPLDTGIAPYNVAAADFDGNGRPDVAAASAHRGHGHDLPAAASSGGFTQESPTLVGTGRLQRRRRRGLQRRRHASTSPATAARRRPRATCARPTARRLRAGGRALTRSGRRTAITAADLNGDGGSTSSSGASATDSVYYALRNAREHRLSRRRCQLPVDRPEGRRRRRATSPATASRTSSPTNDNARRRTTCWVAEGRRHLRTGRPTRPFDARRPASSAWPSPTSTGTAAPTWRPATTRTTPSTCMLGQGGRRVRAPRRRTRSGDGPAGHRRRPTSTRTASRTSRSPTRPGMRVTVLLRTATGFEHDPSSPILTSLAATGIGDRRTSTQTRGPTSPWPTSLEHAEHPHQLDAVPAASASASAAAGPRRRQRRRAAPDGLRRRQSGGPCPRRGGRARATGSTRTARAATRRSPVLKRTVAYKLGYGEGVHDLLLAARQARARGRQDQVRLQGQGLQAQEGEDQGEEERRRRLADALRQGRAAQAGHEGRDPRHATGERRPLPPLHDPLGQAAEADPADAWSPGSSKPVKC